MKDQHKKIAGYRDLTQEEIDLINRIKVAEELVADLLPEIRAAVDRIGDAAGVRWLALARTELETGFMYAVKAVAQPGNGMGRARI